MIDFISRPPAIDVISQLFGRCAPFHDIELTTVLPIGFSCWTVGSTERKKPGAHTQRLGPATFAWRSSGGKPCRPLQLERIN
jgi:hypothetical protein